MASKQVTLEIAAFLDSDQAQALDVPPREDVRRIVGRFLVACYEGLGTKPRLLDAHDLHGVLGHILPGHFQRKDPLATHVGEVLRAYLAFLAESQIVPNDYELRRSLEETLPEFEETVRTGQNAHHQRPKQAPVVHRAEKLGRNDPCFCGSGKKFKKCHGKQG